MNTTTIENETNEAKVKTRRHPEPGERVRVLAEWATSGKTVEEMVAATGWSSYTLYRWRAEAGQGKRTKPKAPPPPRPKMLAVPKPTAAAPGTWAAEVLIGSVSVRLSAGCPVTWAGQLVRELKPC
jgi:transposase-like protein